MFSDLPTVQACRSSPVKAEAYGIESASKIRVGDIVSEQPRFMLEYYGDYYAIFRHPQLLVTNSIKSWLREYNYCGAEHYAAVPFLERHPCAVEAKEIYESALSYFRK